MEDVSNLHNDIYRVGINHEHGDIKENDGAIIQEGILHIASQSKTHIGQYCCVHYFRSYLRWVRIDPTECSF